MWIFKWIQRTVCIDTSVHKPLHWTALIQIKHLTVDIAAVVISQSVWILYFKTFMRV